MRSGSASIAAGVLLACAACARGPGAEYDPHPLRITPSRGLNRAPLPVLIEGDGFFAVPVQNVGGGPPIGFEQQFEVWIGDVALEQVVRASDHALQALVPAGVPPGRHDLTVKSPLGRSGRLAQAWLSSDEPFSRLSGTLDVARDVVVASPIEAVLTLSNPSDGTVRDVRPTLTWGGTAPAVPLGDSPAAAHLPPGGAVVLRWRLLATASGTLELTAAALGTDDESGAEVQMPEAQARVVVLGPPQLRGEVSATPMRVSAGQTFQFNLEIFNLGGLGATDVAPRLSISGAGDLDVLDEPAPQEVPAGGSRVFSWSCRADTPGRVTVASRVSATAAITGERLDQDLAPPVDLEVQSPALLTAALEAPARVSTGQGFAVRVHVHNVGQALARQVAASAVVSGGTGSAVSLESVGPEEVEGGATRTFTLQFRAIAPGTLLLGAAVNGTDSNSGEVVEATASSASGVVVQAAASLAASLVPSRTLVESGETFAVALQVTNTGEATALAVAPAPPEISGSSGATLVSGPVPSRADLPGGAVQSFTWRYVPGAAGILELHAAAQGTDANSSAPVASPRVSADLTVQRPPELAATLSTSRSLLLEGESFTVTLLISNLGDATARSVAPGPLVVSGTSTASPVTGPSPTLADIAGGASQAFAWEYAAGGAGTIELAASASGIDANTGAQLLTPLATAGALAVRERALLSATFSVPAEVHLGTPFVVSLTVSNSGDSTAEAVTPSAIVLSGSGVAAPSSGPDPAAAAIPGGSSQAFSWIITATVEGEVTFRAGASGIDAADGAALSATAAASSAVRVLGIVEPEEEFVAEPFSDGTSFAFVFAQGGQLYLGPNQSGTGAVRMNPDGSSPQSVAFAFSKDLTGNTSSNDSPAPYPSVGSAGCAADSAACGPDNEDGRGLFGSGSIGGADWLLIGGARSNGDLSYIYMSNDSGTTLRLRYVDLHNVLGGATKGLSAMHVFKDRVYLGFPDGGGSRPYLIALLRAPPEPGLDATAGADAESLQAEKMPGIRVGNPAAMVMVDTLADFNDRLYLANNGGIARSTLATPRPYGDAPGDWATVTPSCPAYQAKTSLATTKAADLLPSDKAVPAMAAFGGRFFLARNTTSGPQLFGCDPATSGSTTDCDAGDWTLVAPNSTGDVQLSQFDDPDNTSIALLLATPGHLYVGFNNRVDGVALYRAASPPSSRSDFTGEDECSAAAAPSGCAGLRGSGLGIRAKVIFDAAALATGAGHSIYLTVGDGGAGPVRVIRLVE